jgi:hypothetical protein
LIRNFGEQLGLARDPEPSAADAEPPPGGNLTVVTPSERDAWAVAAWAVANAEALHIDAVTAGTQRWQRGWGEWRDHTPALAPGEVTVELSD